MASPGWVKAQLAERERPVSRPALHMRWENLLFLHWAWDMGAIQKTLPPGLVVDTFEGQAWLGVVPFFMCRVHPRGLPCVPWLSDFLELNVRTYVRDARGVPGVWFYSLSCNQPLAVRLARSFFHLNYVDARMGARRENARVVYHSERRSGVAAEFQYGSSGPFRPTEVGSLEFFLAERYELYSVDRRGRLFRGKVHHPPYSLAAAEVGAWSFEPALADGFSEPCRPPDHMAMAQDLQVEAWPLIPLVNG
jgi:uncharacterized protein